MESIGHSFWIIGLTTAVFNSTRIIAPNIWGYLSDRTGQPLKIIRIGCSLASISVVGLLVFDSVYAIVLVLLFYSFFWNAVLPQFEVLTYQHLGKQSADKYGPIRLWGSLGFAFAVIFGGWLFEKFELALFPWLIFILLLLLWVSSLVVPAISLSKSQSLKSGKAIAETPFRSNILQLHVLVYIACLLLMQVSFGPYYTFFSIYLVDMGYPVWSIGGYWAVAIAAEILVFLVFGRLHRYLGLRNLLLLSLVAGVLRWWLLGRFGSNGLILVGVQILHAFSFGTFHVCMVESVRRFFPTSQHGKGQALFNSMGYGLGTVVGAALSGLFWDTFANQLFYFAAATSALSLLLVLVFLKTEHFQYKLSSKQL